MTQYDEIGDAYIEAQNKAKMPHEVMGHDFLRDIVSRMRPSVVVDLGCGHGPDIPSYLGMGSKVIGVDESKVMIRHAKQRSPYASFRIADVRKTRIASGSVDAVVSRFGVHYPENMDEVYAESHRILKKNGLLAFVLPHPVTLLLQSPSKQYGVQETFDVPIYRGQFTVRLPTHTFENYLSHYFIEHFSLTELREVASGQTVVAGYKVPDMLALAAVKR